MPNEVMLTEAERSELESRVRRRNLRADDVRRARLILMLADDATYRDIQEALACNSGYISRWKSRFLEQRLGGLFGRHRGRKPTVITPALEARVLNWTRKPPTDGSTHWSTRRLAKKLGVNHMVVARVWKRAGIKPHRIERYMASNDPDFESKAADIIGLYVNPPQHAAVFCVDEKSQIQALDRLDPVLPFSPGRLERHGFEYYRHGTLSLFAAFNTKTGDVFAKPYDRQSSEEFVAFLGELVASQPNDREVHVILDNLSTHRSKRTKSFLEHHPNVHLHFTPTYSSWLNQIEIWFAKIERDVIARGVFTSVKDLARKLMRYIKHYNKEPKPIRWAYTDVSRRIHSDAGSSVTGH